MNLKLNKLDYCILERALDGYQCELDNANKIGGEDRNDVLNTLQKVKDFMASKNNFKEA